MNLKKKALSIATLVLSLVPQLQAAADPVFHRRAVVNLLGDLDWLESTTHVVTVEDKAHFPDFTDSHYRTVVKPHGWKIRSREKIISARIDAALELTGNTAKPYIAPTKIELDVSQITDDEGNINFWEVDVPTTTVQGVNIKDFTFMTSIELIYETDEAETGEGISIPFWATERISGHTTATRSSFNNYTKVKTIKGKKYYANANEDHAFVYTETALSAEFGFNQYVRHARSNSNIKTVLYIDETDSLVDTPFEIKLKALGNQKSAEADNAKLSSRIADANARELHPILYFKDTGFEELSKEDYQGYWCRSFNGTEQSAAGDKGKIFMDLSSDFKDKVAAQLEYLASDKIGGDAFYFDYKHLNPSGCFGTKLETDFRTDFPNDELPDEDGLISGVKLTSANDWRQHSSYAKFQQFQAKALTNAFIEWKEKDSLQDSLFIVSTTQLSGLLSFAHEHALAENADMIKTEINHGKRPGIREQVGLDVDDFSNELMILANNLPRDLSISEISHIWGAQFPGEGQITGFIEMAIALGGIPDVTVLNEYLDKSNNTNPKDEVIENKKDDITTYTKYYSTSKKDLINGIARGRSLSASMKRTLPMKYASVLFSEALRKKYIEEYNTNEADANGYTLDKNMFENLWEDAVKPSVSAYSQFLKQGVPVTVVSDNMIANGTNFDSSKLKVLYVPFTDSQLDAYASTGSDSGVFTGIKNALDIMKTNGVKIFWGTPTLPNLFQSNPSEPDISPKFWVVNSDPDTNNDPVFPFFYEEPCNGVISGRVKGDDGWVGGKNVILSGSGFNEKWENGGADDIFRTQNSRNTILQNEDSIGLYEFGNLCAGDYKIRVRNGKSEGFVTKNVTLESTEDRVYTINLTKETETP